MGLRAVVIGAGWAGEGHTIALQASGVEVIALCGRAPEPAYARANQLGIADVRFDWRAALTELRPDIVAIGTPGDTHREMAEHALSLGCHVMCEKPLALNATDARAMLDAAVRAGVKHAYGPTGRYAPSVIYAQQLVVQGAIGPVREIELTSRGEFPPLPYGWVHQLERGGGLLNNGFTHNLAQVLRVTGGEPIAAIGAARTFHERAPVGPPIHDFRQLFGPIPGWDPAQATEWRTADADAAYTAIVELCMPEGHTAQASFVSSIYGQSPNTGDLAVFCGDAGTLVFNSDWGAAPLDLRLYRKTSGAWEDLRVPDAVLAAQPPVEDTIQRYWNQLFLEFVADIHGEGNAGYPTFHDGWVAMEIIDAVRERRQWRETAQSVAA
jgi:predicted dehydrogenase